MGRAAKMASGQYQGQGDKQDMSKGGPKQTPRKQYQKPSQTVNCRGAGEARHKQCKMY